MPATTIRPTARRSTSRTARAPQTTHTACALAVAAALAQMAQPAVAANCTWNPASGNWSVAGNWSCSLVPGAADTATIAATRSVTIDTTQSILSLSNAGTVNIDAANFSMTDDGTITPDDVNLPDVYRPTISVNGFGGNGGDISIVTSAFTLGEFHRFEATGTGTGGNIDITADTIDLAGALVATGGAGGGLVTTTAPISLFAGPTAYIRADTWRLHVPSAHILMTDVASPGSGAVLTDDALAVLDGVAVDHFHEYK